MLILWTAMTVPQPFQQGIREFPDFIRWDLRALGDIYGLKSQEIRCGDESLLERRQNVREVRTIEIREHSQDVGHWAGTASCA